eukprot:TRINITY_DN11371_c0_g1_i2.p1 TRINITY_DN11371_c0_g1~~TRINITY_DN11371_c0_g1_i2.p1  ORF type:complete len:195 (-),score=30.28 TRINITY_DN11371_c0_g1_i2:97-681(-)
MKSAQSPEPVVIQQELGNEMVLSPSRSKTQDLKVTNALTVQKEVVEVVNRQMKRDEPGISRLLNLTEAAYKKRADVRKSNLDLDEKTKMERDLAKEAMARVLPAPTKKTPWVGSGEKKQTQAGTGRSSRFRSGKDPAHVGQTSRDRKVEENQFERGQFQRIKEKQQAAVRLGSVGPLASTKSEFGGEWEDVMRR